MSCLCMHIWHKNWKENLCLCRMCVFIPAMTFQFPRFVRHSLFYFLPKTNGTQTKKNYSSQNNNKKQNRKWLRPKGKKTTTIQFTRSIRLTRIMKLKIEEKNKIRKEKWVKTWYNGACTVVHKHNDDKQDKQKQNSVTVSTKMKLF